MNTERRWASWAGAAGEQGVRVALEVIDEPGDGLGGFAELLDGHGGFGAQAALRIDERLRRRRGLVEARERGARLLQGGGELGAGRLDRPVDRVEGRAKVG